MTITRVQVATGAVSTAVTSSAAPALPAAATAGNLLVAAWGIDKNAGTITAPSGWTVLASQVGTSVSLLVAYKIAAGGDATPTATWTTGNAVSTLIAEYTGVNTTTPGGPSHLPAYSDANATTLTLDPAAATSAGAALAFFAIDSMTTAGSTTDFQPAATGFTWVATAAHATGTGTPGTALVENLTISAGQDIAPTFTWTRSDQVAGFIVLLNAAGSTNTPPTANAGPDQSAVEPWEPVTLTGTDSDPDGTIASRSWTQTGGSPTVTLTGTGATRTFEAPGTIAGTTLTFSYSVTDNAGATSTPDPVSVTVLPVTERAVIGGVEVPMRIRLL